MLERMTCGMWHIKGIIDFSLTLRFVHESITCLSLAKFKTTILYYTYIVLAPCCESIHVLILSNYASNTKIQTKFDSTAWNYMLKSQNKIERRKGFIDLPSRLRYNLWQIQREKITLMFRYFSSGWLNRLMSMIC